VRHSIIKDRSKVEGCARGHLNSDVMPLRVELGCSSGKVFASRAKEGEAAHS
jgi:hypothetical protein